VSAAWDSKAKLDWDFSHGHLPIGQLILNYFRRVDNLSKLLILRRWWGAVYLNVQLGTFPKKPQSDFRHTARAKVASWLTVLLYVPWNRQEFFALGSRKPILSSGANFY
jgi:hypothetical protein